MSHIWIPNKDLLIPARDVDLGTDHAIKQFIKMVAHKVDSRGKIIRSRVAAEFPNLVTDGGMDRIGNNNGAGAYCQVGTGTRTPGFSDTALVNRIAASNTETSGGTTATIIAGPPRYSSNVSGRRFAAGVAAGNLTEVGFSWTNTATLYNYALIQDSLGNPITITILSDEILDVFLETRFYIPTGDSAPFIITLAGVDYTFVRRPMRNTQPTASGSSSTGWGFANTPGSFTQAGFKGDAGGGTGAQIGSTFWNGAMTTENGTNPTGTRGTSSSTVAGYTDGSYQRNGTIRAGISESNLAGGISAFSLITNWSSWQFSISPAIPKTSSQTLVLNVRQSWSRH